MRRRFAPLLAATALIGAAWTSAAQQPVQDAPPSMPQQPAQNASPPAQQQSAQQPARPTPQMQSVLDQLQQLGAKPIHTLTPEAAREQPSFADAVKAAMEQQNMAAPDQGVRTEDIPIPGGGPNGLPARLYSPSGESQGPRPLIVYFHGGGWVVADLDTYDATPRALAAQTGAIVVSAHYRQAPEHPFPAAHDDAMTVWRWAVQNAASIGADPLRIAVAGESAGGNLALNVARLAREQDVRAPVHVLAVYPVAGTDMSTPSYREHADAKPLGKADMEWFLNAYAPEPEQRSDPRLDLFAAEWRNAPRATVVLAEIDPLRSEGERIAQTLEQAGSTDVAVRSFPGVTHEFFGAAPLLPEAAEAQAFAADRLKESFAQAAQARR